jgi:hypothetical protein
MIEINTESTEDRFDINNKAEMCENESADKDEEGIKINIEIEDDFYQSVVTYVEGKLSHKTYDISYEWLLRDINMCIITKGININTLETSSVLETRDVLCEYKVIHNIIYSAAETNNRRQKTQRSIYRNT